MKQSVTLLTFLFCLVFVWLIQDAMAFQIITKEMMETETVTETDLIRTVDNFIVLFDTSGSANKLVPGRNVSKIEAAKTMLKERNSWLPDLGYNAGLYIYTNNETLMGTFKEVYGVKPYDRAAFGAAIDQLPDKGEGPTMLQAGFHGLRKLVAGLTGKTAIIMFTDGTFTINRGIKKPLQIAQEIARDNDVCFYLISSAQADTEKQLLNAVSAVNPCSRVVPLATFLDNPNYIGGALYTTKTTSYERLKPVTQVVGVKMENILFDFNSADLRSEYEEKLNKLGDYLKNNPDAYVVAGGFADSVGDEDYNLALSQRRADSVKAYLMDQAGIEGDRVVDLWFGELNPIADNDTAQGRQLNRRVEIAVGK